MITSFIIRDIPLASGVPQAGNAHNPPQQDRICSGVGMTVQLNPAHQPKKCDRDGCEVLHG